jgi:hypothetical protein
MTTWLDAIDANRFEPADGDEAATLPDYWRQEVAVGGGSQGTAAF